MPPEPASDAERIQRFVKPVGVLLTERADVLARVYAGVMAGGQGYEDARRSAAQKAVIDFLTMIDP